MLQKFAQLGTEIEGRYATNSELEELEVYLSSIEQRVSAYEKIANQSKEIINTVIQKSTIKLNLPQNNDLDFQSKCQRDMAVVLLSCSASMLINDLDRLREGFLLWLQTIIIALQLTGFTRVEYQILKDLIKDLLTPEEMELMLPALQLSHTLLGG